MITVGSSQLDSLQPEKEQNHQGAVVAWSSGATYMFITGRLARWDVRQECVQALSPDPPGNLILNPEYHLDALNI
jgi:hypothetical protein